MKKMLLLLVAAVALSSVYASPAAAQSAAAAIVKIPFQFIAAGRVLPAGSYRIDPQTADWSTIKISSADEKAAIAVFVGTNNREPVGPNKGDASVRFVTYGGQHFLQEVYVPGRNPREVTITASRAQQLLVKLNLTSAEPADVAK